MRAHAHIRDYQLRRLMRTFLLNDVFRPNPDLQLYKEKVGAEIPALIAEQTLHDLDGVRELVLSSPAANWKHRPGGKNFVDYQDCRLRYPVMGPLDLWQFAINVVREAYGKKTVPGVDGLDVNCFFQINPRCADTSFVHDDAFASAQLFTCLIYLNSEAECSGGTAFYRHRQFGPSSAPGDDSLDVFYEQHLDMLEESRCPISESE